MPILDEIVADKKIEIAKLKENLKGLNLNFEINKLPRARNFLKAVSAPVSLIAEIKKASPSAGIIRDDFDPVKIAKNYEKAGANAVSVLTDSKYFAGSIDYLKSIAQAVAIPVLRKDFIIDEIQIYESRLNGADAILLIAAILTDEELSKFAEISERLGMAQIIEVHNQEELLRVLKISPKIIGINNRDLKTFKVDMSTTYELVKLIPKGRVPVIISESGIKNTGQIKELYKAGVNAVLMGEELMKAQDAGAKIKELFAW